MIKFLHTADLHLKASQSEDSDYSLECLGILIQKANEHQVDAVLFCGDIFDTESDYADPAFTQKVTALFNEASMPLYCIPGNHENKEGNFARLKNTEFGEKATVILSPRILVHKKGGHEVEIAAIPHAPSYEGFPGWAFPEKKATHRIAMAHGEIPGYPFVGDEDTAGVLNPAIFLHHKVNHVFLGHIHVQGGIDVSGVQFHYAGSPRPVRSKEVGVRSYNLIEIADHLQVKTQLLPEVGVMRRLQTAVLDPRWPEEIEAQVRTFHSKDRLKIFLNGLVQDDANLDQAIQTLLPQLQSRLRRVEIVRHLEPLEDLLQNPFFKSVYTIWLSRKPQDSSSREYLAWLKMLNQLKFMKAGVLR